MLSSRLFAVMLLLSLPFAGWAYNPAKPGVGMMETAWAADVPFVPDAAAVGGGELSVIRLTGEKAEVATAKIGAAGLVPPPPTEDGSPRGDIWTAREVVLSEVAPGADEVFGSGGRFFFFDKETRRLTMTAADLGSPLAAGDPLPMGQIDELMVEGETLFVLGPAGVELLLVGRTLGNFGASADAGGGWQMGWPAPEARSRATMSATQGRLHLAGGEVVVNGERIAPRFVYRAEYTAEGKPAQWQQIVQNLPRPSGPARMTDVNDFVVLAPEIPGPTNNGTLTSQTLLTAVDRPGGYLSTWREFVMNVPLLRSPLLVPYEEEHLLLVLGGERQTDGAENRKLWAIKMLPTPTSEAKQPQPASTPPPMGARLIDYRTGLKIASRDRKYHLVFLSDDAAGDKLLEKVRTDRNIYLMVEDMVLSKPDPMDLADAEAKAGEHTKPCLMLLDPDGHPLGNYEGVPERQRMFEFLKVVWGPKG